MALPKSGKPRASDVVEWCNWLVKKGIGTDVDGRYGR